MKATLLSYRDLAPGVRHFEFEAEAPISYTSGQFVSVHAEIAGKAITRAYSIASAPQGARFELCLNLVEDGRLSPVLFALAPGGAIDFTGPLGYFVWKQPIADSLLVATGTGIAPMRAMLPAALAQNPGTRFTLLFGTRTPESILYHAEFEDLARRHANFQFWPTLSRADSAWGGRRGHVQQHLAEAVDGRSDIDIYICGLRAMVDDVRARLKEMGFDRKRIVSERYD